MKKIIGLIIAIAIILSFIEKNDNIRTKIEKMTGNLTNTIISTNKNNINNLEEVTLINIIDGDTISVTTIDGEKNIRLLSIDTPESVHADASKNCEEGKIASQYTKDILTNIDTLYLQYDKQIEDQYGRTLAYVWLSNNINIIDQNDIETYMLNAILCKNGYAKEWYNENNNIYYYNIFKKLSDEAIEKNISICK